MILYDFYMILYCFSVILFCFYMIMGPKMQLLMDFVAYPMGVAKRIDFEFDFESSFIHFWNAWNLENRAPVLAPYLF